MRRVLLLVVPLVAALTMAALAVAACAPGGADPVAGPPTEAPSSVAPMPTPSATPVAATAAPPTYDSAPDPRTCHKLPVYKTTYWQAYALPPATCSQANSILPRGIYATRGGETEKVSGWTCTWNLSDDVTCRKGKLTIYADLKLS